MPEQTLAIHAHTSAGHEASGVDLTCLRVPAAGGLLASVQSGSGGRGCSDLHSTFRMAAALQHTHDLLTSAASMIQQDQPCSVLWQREPHDSHCVRGMKHPSMTISMLSGPGMWGCTRSLQPLPLPQRSPARQQSSGASSQVRKRPWAAAPPPARPVYSCASAA